MKLQNIAIVSAVMISTATLQAASSIQLEIGEFKDTSGDNMVVGTWLAILDTNNDGILPGGLAAGSTSNGALSILNAADMAKDFSGVTLGLGSIGDDEIIRVSNVGDVDLGAAYAVSTISFSDGQEELAYGIYWVPGLNPGQQMPSSGTFQLGGYFQSDTAEFAEYGMFAPPAPVALEPAVFDVGSFNAVTVTAIPESSTFALAAFAALGLLRRRRI